MSWGLVDDGVTAPRAAWHVLMDTPALALARNGRHLAWLARMWPMN